MTAGVRLMLLLVVEEGDIGLPPGSGLEYHGDDVTYHGDATGFHGG